MNTYTVFCRQANNLGTTWIDRIEAENLDQAAEVAREKCAADWGYDSERLDQITVVGIAEGDVNILFWEDIDD